MNKWTIWGFYPYFWKHPSFLEMILGGFPYFSPPPFGVNSQPADLPVAEKICLDGSLRGIQSSRDWQILGATPPNPHHSSGPSRPKKNT